MTIRSLAIAALFLVAAGANASAQDVRGFAGGGVTGTINNEQFPFFGGGAVVDVGQPWVSVGGQGEALMSWPYFAGRGAVFGQANLMVRKPLRPFVLIGAGFGEESGPLMIGGGLELRAPNGRMGFRVSVEDYVKSLDGYDAPPGYRYSYPATTSHQITLRAALLF